MPDVTLSFVAHPIGTQLDVYPRRSELIMSDYSPPPMISKVGQGVVADDASVSLAGLPEGELWAIANPPNGLGYVAFVA